MYVYICICMYSLYITMTTKNTNELNDLDNHVINAINQLRKWKKRADVDMILNQIIKNNDCVN